MEMTWIWTTETEAQADIYRCFRKSFTLNKIEYSSPLWVEISADSL